MNAQAPYTFQLDLVGCKPAEIVAHRHGSFHPLPKVCEGESCLPCWPVPLSALSRRLVSIFAARAIGFQEPHAAHDLLGRLKVGNYSYSRDPQFFAFLGRRDFDFEPVRGRVDRVALLGLVNFEGLTNSEFSHSADDANLPPKRGNPPFRQNRCSFDDSQRITCKH